MFTRLAQKRTRLADNVYEQILSAILSGEIMPGERLIQETIASQIDVSRTPVREAFLRLEREGVLEAAGRGGFQIRNITEQEIKRSVSRPRGRRRIRSQTPSRSRFPKNKHRTLKQRSDLRWN